MKKTLLVWLAVGAFCDALVAAERFVVENGEPRAEIGAYRIPTTTDDVDPLHLVVGRKPSVSLPWFISIGRQRARDNDEERSALSPTGAERWHDVIKFAHFYHGNHNEFEADPSVPDFLSDLRAATELVNEKKPDKAIADFQAGLPLTSDRNLRERIAEALKKSAGDE